MTLHLHALGHFHPENEIDNRFLESLEIGTSDEWILERVGIRSRRTVLPLDYIRRTRNTDIRATAEAALYTTSQLSARAAELAIARAGIDKNAIGLVLSGSSASDSQCPADAAWLARHLELEVPAFDVNSACTSFLAELNLLAMLDPAKVPDYVLVAGVDAVTRTVDYRDRSTAVLWGDAAIAAIVSTRVPGRARILGTALEASPAGCDKVVIPRAGYFQQEGKTVQAFAIKKTARMLLELREEFETGGRRFHFVGHQANLRMLESVCRRCEIPEDRHHSNVEWFGNTGAASSGSVISMNWDKWTTQDDVAVCGVGGGLAWARYLIRFGDGA
jgi:3-oxoacyl-[acyl-carrier-protein] synthase-3